MFNRIKARVNRPGAQVPEEEPRPLLAIDLLIVDGMDVGQRFTVDGDEAFIGRRVSGTVQTKAVLLRDPAVSLKQAFIRREGDSFMLTHVPEATNPTQVDGVPVEVAPILPGARIQVGRTRIEVCQRDGATLGNLTEFLALEKTFQKESDNAGSAGSEDPGQQATTVRGMVSEVGRLIFERGSQAGDRTEYPIWSTRTSLGRSIASDVHISDGGVSREHAEIEHQDGQLRLIHKSRVNQTLHNGRVVDTPVLLKHGDTIQLADRAVLRVECDLPEAGAGQGARGRLQSNMEDRVALDQQIEQRFSVEGSFLDLDVVNSSGMKTASQRADHIVVSFERFRNYAREVTEEFHGVVLNSNGDELMCFFQSTPNALTAGSHLLSRLGPFNREQNLLPLPFQFRIGIHTGRSLVDFEAGVAYSAILDVAGHLQKLAEPNGLLFSEQTRAALPEDLPLEFVGTTEKEGIDFYRFSD